MHLKNIIPIPLGILLIALVVAAACVSPSATPATHNPGKSLVKPTVTAQAANREAVAVTSAPNTGNVTNSMATALLGRPTDHSVNINVLPAENLELCAEYRNSTGTSFFRTPAVAAVAGVPQNIVIFGLAPDTDYTYHLCYHKPGNTAFQYSSDYSFHTARGTGASFVFDVQADSHLDDRASEDLYRVNLNNELNDKPDFLIDLGDTSMTDKLPVKNNATYLERYLLQRSFLDTVGHSVPLFLVLGNHDREAGYALDGTGNNIAILSLQFRKQYFPNPEPDNFYTGNNGNELFTGPREDYYAWQWGDALFVVIDPYWYTMTKPGGKNDGWGWTLGKTQYQWLNQTLTTSTAKYKFVFSHQLVGGDSQGRGGTEYASLYEWGGKNTDGSWGFDQNRPGWGVPIHQMLVRNNVTAFFHGHDHFFGRQELDGVVYQEVPQPATIGSPAANPGIEYGYVNGTMLSSPGHLRITVGPESARVDYIWSALPEDKRSDLKNGAVAYSYTLKPGP